MIQMINIDRLQNHPNNPRKNLTDLNELADSIKAKGVLQNLTVVPNEQIDERGRQHYNVVIGNRRLAAARIAGLMALPCSVVEMSERDQMATMMLENMQRTDLTVYEQAQGFQTMMDLGMSMGDISGKTGFSQATIRRRMKLMELDQDRLREVAGRQVSMADFDQLAKIEDVELRNECLKNMGTREFEMSVQTALRKEKTARAIPPVKKRMLELGAKEIAQDDCYSNKYCRIGSMLYLYDLNSPGTVKPGKQTDELYYYLDEKYGILSFYEKAKRAAPVKRQQAEIDREKQVEAAWAALKEKTAIAYERRIAFMRGVKATAKNQNALLRGTLLVGVVSVLTYTKADAKSICTALGISDNWQGCTERAMAAMDNLSDAFVPAVLYALFGDTKNNGYAGGYGKDFPRRVDNKPLDALYKVLGLLGYEMSNEERELQAGTHPLFAKEDGADAAG